MTHDQRRLRYQCRRGMLELDAILQPFFEQHFQHLSQAEQEQFEQLLTLPDPVLYQWFIGSDTPIESPFKLLIDLIKSKNLG